MKLLIVEDEPTVAHFIEQGLTEAGFTCDLASDGQTGLDLAIHGAKESTYAVSILDRMLPKLDGLEVLKQLREQNITTPVLFLSAKNKVEDKVTGLRAGADDYLTKPFALEELLARIEILGSRAGASSKSRPRWSRN